MKTAKLFMVGMMAGFIFCLLLSQNVTAGNVEIENNADETISVATSADGDRHIVYAKKGERVKEVQFSVQAITKIMVAREPNEQKHTPFTPLKVYNVVRPNMMKDYKVVISTPGGAEKDVQITEINKYNVL